MTDLFLSAARSRRASSAGALALLVLASGLPAQEPRPRDAGPALVTAHAEQVAEVIPGRYLVQVRTETALRRARLGEELRSLRLAHRSRMVRGGEARGSATPAPLLSPAAFRRQVLRSNAFRATRERTRASLQQILDTLGRDLGRPLQPRHTYDVIYGGFALELTPEEADRLATHPLVAHVEPERSWPLQSDVSPDIAKAPDVWAGIVTGSPLRGAGILVGVIDSGIEPLHLSFAAVPGVVNPLGSGNYLGVCLELVDGMPNPIYDPAFPCSDKLVGAYDLTTATESLVEGPDDGAFSSHGSHVASIAVGNEIDAGYGTNPAVPHMRGIAPLSSIVAYDACVTGAAPTYPETCDGGAILAAIDQAMADGVDVLNISIKGSTSPWISSEAVALLEAFDAGVLTVASAGNDGPGDGTVTRLEPWVLNIGATTHDRLAYLAVFSASGGDNSTRPTLFSALGMGPAIPTAEIVQGSDYDGNTQCDAPFDDDILTGKIVLCQQGGVPPLHVAPNKANALANSGALAVLSYAGAKGTPIFATEVPYFLLPVGMKADFETWLNTAAATPPRASLAPGTLVRDPSYADIVMFFSSRGPATGFDLLKPDLVAPGSNVMAAADSEYVVEVPEQGGYIAGLRYNSGTSMATPAGAGAAALLREMHPTLSVAELQSILRISADPTGLTECPTAAGIWGPPCSVPLEPAGLFDFGSGRLDVTAAAKAGVAFDVTCSEFFAANPGCTPLAMSPCDLGGMGPLPCDPAGPSQLNLPSMAKEDCGAGCSFVRRAGSIAASTVDWSTSFLGPRDAAPPSGIEAHVVPTAWTLAPGADQPFVVGVYATDPDAVDEWQELVLMLTPDDPGVSPARLPIVVKPTSQPASSDLQVSARVATGPRAPGDLVQFEVTVRNLGAVPAVGVEVAADTLGGLIDPTWTCVPPARNWCGSGDGALTDLAAILPGDQIVYLFEGIAQDPLPDPIQFDVTISAPTGLNDSVADNDSATVYASTVLFADGFESGDTTAWD